MTVKNRVKGILHDWINRMQPVDGSSACVPVRVWKQVVEDYRDLLPEPWLYWHEGWADDAVMELPKEIWCRIASHLLQEKSVPEFAPVRQPDQDGG